MKLLLKMLAVILVFTGDMYAFTFLTSLVTTSSDIAVLAGAIGLGILIFLNILIIKKSTK